MVAGVLAAASFLNMVGVHLAVRALKRRVEHILDRIDGMMDDPTGALSPHVIAFMSRLNDDRELQAAVGGGFAFAARTAMNTVQGGGGAENPDGSVKPPRGVIGQLTQGIAFLKQMGLIGGKG